MEENKTVEKSGLPVVINGVVLTEKDLHCVMQHLSEFVRREWHHQEDVPGACAACKFLSQCSRPTKRFPNGEVDPWAAFRQLSEATGVHLCHWNNCTAANHK